MADLKDFAEQLVNLTVKEVNELAQILKDEYGIEPAAAAAGLLRRSRQPRRRRFPEVERRRRQYHPCSPRRLGEDRRLETLEA